MGSVLCKMGNCPYHIWITSFLLGNDHLSKNLAFSTPRTGLTREWHPPTQGEQCIAFSPGSPPVAGIVWVGLLSANRPVS
ncbi:hypothetical protein FOB43_03485 [Chromobacterium violaceum]|nr:hypothetical protein FOB43_03485 [Chromobacterium violaceum]